MLRDSAEPNREAELKNNGVLFGGPRFYRAKGALGGVL
jgi:hypothetical protein